MKEINKDEQKSLAKEADGFSLRLGDKWYVVDISWYQKWTNFIGLETNETFGSPGVINNKALLDADGNLKEGVTEYQDYKVVPEKVWKFLVQTYGTESDKDIIERKVINESMASSQRLTIEVNYLRVTAQCVNWVSNEMCLFYLSRQTPLKTVVEKLKIKYEIPIQRDVRVYFKSLDLQNNLIENYETQTLASAGFSSNDTFVLSVQGDDGNWVNMNETGRISSQNTVGGGAHSAHTQSTVNRGSPSILNSSNTTEQQHGGVRSSTAMVTRSSKTTYDVNYSNRHNESRPGLCGLYNLGNTCFMNSAIQCMSNVPLLTEYFKSGKYLKEINKENPLGRKGELAYAYAELVNEMWSGTNSYTTPRQFKMHISKFAPQFTGYQQQDSQELLAYMLDGLHEDLNRILKKPYIPGDDDLVIPDYELARITWENYLKRNDSIIVDIFHGLIKSTLNCLECNKISIKFDPICYLSLPLPSKKERLIEVKFVPLNTREPVVKYKLNVLKNSTIKDLLKALEDLTGVQRQKFVCCDVYGNKFFHIYETHENISSIREKDDIFIYELPVETISQDHFKFQFYLKNRSMHHYSNTYFGLPLIMTVPKDDLTPAVIYDQVTNSLKRFLNDTDATNLQQDSGSEEINKKLNHSLDFNDDRSNENDSEVDNLTTRKTRSSTSSNKLFKLYLSKSDSSSTYGDSDQQQQIDEKAIGLLNSTNGYYLLIGDFTSQVKDHLYNNKLYENAVEHESCSAKLLNKRDVLKLEDCFNLFTKKEELSDSDLWYCPTCKKHQHATKQIDLWSLPPVLVIHLKRFSYSRVFRDKIDTLVEFPVTDFDLSNYVKNTEKKHNSRYNLIAVSNHYGGLGGGHYTAYGQNRHDGRWYHFDDSSVNAVDESTVCTPAAYLLIYLRQDLHATNIRSEQVEEASKLTANNNIYDNEMEYND